MPVSVKIEQFDGPLDLLLQLVEKEELDITEISLAAVAEQYVEYLNANKGKIPAEELADFLVIAAKLVFMKSRLLIPSLEEEAIDEGPDLATQLRLYQQFVGAARKIEGMWNAGLVSYARERRAVRSLEKTFSPPPGVTSEVLREMMARVIARLAPVVKLPSAAVKRVITIQEKIADLANRLRTKTRMTFSHFLSAAKDRQERVVSFLALLELVKQRVIHAEQSDLFDEIEIAANDLDRIADLKIEFV
jgi:segregation and condensation protein A